MTTTTTDQLWIAPGEQGFLVGETLYLRPPEAGDAQYAAAWHDSPYPITRQRAEKIINEEFPKEGDRRIAHLVACRRDDDSPVGGAVYNVWEGRTAFVRVTANPARAHQAAIKAEMLGIMIPWLSAEQRKMVVWAELDAPEPELLAGAEAAGMRPAACFREAIWRNGARHDQWVYELLHPRWRERLGDPGPGIRQAVEPPAVPGYRRAGVRQPGGPVPENALMVGERVAMRLAEPDDGKEISRLARRETEAKWDGGRWMPSAAQFTRWYTESREKDPPEMLLFAVLLRETGQVIGGVELVDINHFHRTAETGSIIYLPELRGQGFGTEAKNLLLEYAFDHLDLHLLKSFVWSYNSRSQAALRKQGYRDAGRLQWRQQTDEGFADFVLFDLLASEWRSRVNASP